MLCKHDMVGVSFKFAREWVVFGLIFLTNLLLGLLYEMLQDSKAAGRSTWKVLFILSHVTVVYSLISIFILSRCLQNRKGREGEYLDLNLLLIHYFD